jgi:hypothetical protein
MGGLRGTGILGLLALFALIVLHSMVRPVPAEAQQEAEALRRELEEVKKRFEAMQAEYLKTIESLSQRIQRLETQPAAPSPPPVAAPAGPAPPPVAAPATPPAPAPTVAQPAAPGPPSVLDLARPREPFGLYQQRGPGQLLFDIGIAGDFVGNITQRNVQKAGGGTFAGRENRFFPREVELSLFGQIDPYASAEVRIEAGEEERGEESGVSLAEATLTFLTLPFGTQAKAGQMRSRFGYSNAIHEHDLPWIDRPNVFRNFLGEEGLQEKGIEMTIVPPLPFFLEALLGVFNGDNETSFGRGSLKAPLVTGRLRTFFELSDTDGLQLGVSAATGEDPDRKRTTLVGGDVRYKHRRVGATHPLLTLTGEALASFRSANVDVDADGDGAVDFVDQRRRDHWGFYVGAEVQPFKRWAVGLRYDWSQYPLTPGSERSWQPYLTFWASEFLRFRLAYKRTDRTHRDPFPGEGSARVVDEILFQGTFLMGAHPAHPF